MATIYDIGVVDYVSLNTAYNAADAADVIDDVIFNYKHAAGGYEDAGVDLAIGGLGDALSVTITVESGARWHQAAAATDFDTAVGNSTRRRNQTTYAQGTTLLVEHLLLRGTANDYLINRTSNSDVVTISQCAATKCRGIAVAATSSVVNCDNCFFWDREDSNRSAFKSAGGSLTCYNCTADPVGDMAAGFGPFEDAGGSVTCYGCISVKRGSGLAFDVGVLGDYNVGCVVSPATDTTAPGANSWDSQDVTAVFVDSANEQWDGRLIVGAKDTYITQDFTANNGAIDAFGSARPGDGVFDDAGAHQLSSAAGAGAAVLVLAYYRTLLGE